jgi:hypothetical protein
LCCRDRNAGRREAACLNGRATQAQSFKPLQIPVGGHKANDGAKPSPSATPEFNPLKHRHMAMPVAPAGELAF